MKRTLLIIVLVAVLNARYYTNPAGYLRSREEDMFMTGTNPAVYGGSSEEDMFMTGTNPAVYGGSD